MFSIFIMTKARPFKLWNADRSVKKGITASTLADLISKGSEKLGYTAPGCQCVLESDGTQVEDEEYFRFIADNTVLQLLQPHEVWLPPTAPTCTYNSHGDELDGGGGVVQLIQQLVANPQQVLLLSDAELEEVSEYSSELQQETRVVQAVHKLMQTRQQVQDAAGLLKLYNDALNCEPTQTAGQPSKKRKK